MRSKVISLLAVAAIIVVALAGCGESTSNAGGNKKNPSDIHVAFVYWTTAINAMSEMAAGAQYAGEQYHVNVQLLAPPNPNDPQAEVNLLINAAKTATDGIAVETLAPDVFDHPEANITGQGIPIIAVDTVAPADTGIKTYVGNDNVAAGKALADAALAKIPADAKGSVVIGNPILAVPVLAFRAQGIKDEFAAKRPDIQVLGPFQTANDPQGNYNAWNNLVNAHPNALAYLGVGDQDSVSLAKIKTANNGKYLTGAFDLNDATIQAVKDGVNFGLLDPYHFMKGYVAMRLLIEHALNGTAIPEGWWNTGHLMVDQTNVDQIIARQASLDAKGAYYKPIIDQQFSNPSAYIKPMDQAK
ncbi:MAG TPA: sugar ABC transporter substrate-binding protein [Ktedonobacterales bacterium]|jgi:ribose transport system substrate-binding protein